MDRGNQTRVTEFILLGLSAQPETQVILFVIFLIVYMITLVGNILIFTVVIIDHRLHTPMYFFLCNLAFLDICYSSMNVPNMIINFLSEEKTISFSACVAQMYISLSLGETECILLAVMAYDRYVAICNPLRYTVIMNRSICIKIAVITWISGFFLAVVHIAFTFQLPFCGHNQLNHFLCEVPAMLRLACADTTINEIVIFVVGVIILMTPVSFILVSYIHVIRAILKISSADGRQKTFSTCASHLTAVTLFFGSAMFMYMRPRSSFTAEVDKRATVFYVVITPMLNPLIYTLRNKEVKGVVKQGMGKSLICAKK
ncbi:LOW QUALITY PROTEIN: olfactory receptor 5V1-like [Rhinatrema bivittatum]|uniref:LOW QUALITY PROTEIN: olfactory receptor 5V1-like n=1 Tax=Rhinatrema bivittatum TaxID=194408 RepID=UPI001128BE34|nr:LOW QUALITY PROTEIN: olfactory receptor 5V1-like [Rhinatrema bivittatum]